MRCLILFIFWLLTLSLRAQNVNTSTRPTNGNVYAIVVGISGYENPGIPALSFAHKDAEVFTNYLTSKSGGSVPTDNIRMLLNEKATYAAIYDALAWALETCKENDLVYFYFSGHGDVENTTIYKLGFLLSYNSPRANYLNSAVRIEDLNNFANTLAVKSKAKVILITDACHSGKLAGTDFRGNFLVGEQLRAKKKNEIRIVSCGEDQLSVEDEGWGGGRGVFSYYLINGLKGQADKTKDGIVTISEIDDFLNTAMAKDALLLQKAHPQNPSVTGNENFTIAQVDKTISNDIVLLSGEAPVVQFLKPLEKSAQSYFFDVLQSQNVEEVYDFKALNSYAAKELPFAFISKLGDSSQVRIDSGKLNELKETLSQNPDALKRFNNKLVVLLSDRGQKIINDYLDGDEAELERRRYYNSNISNYDEYTDMYAVALKLTQPGSYLANILLVKYHYFAGVAARLKMPLVKDPSQLHKIALQALEKANELEPNAAYIKNELGILYSAQNKDAKAKSFFERATQIAPAWSIPWANLSGLYLEQKKLVEATEAVDKALKLQPNYQGNFINLGLIYEQKNNLLFAEEFFRTAIEINSRHYLPFERLGFTYMNTTDYALADSFFYEADKRKKGYHFTNPKYTRVLSPLVEAVTQDFFCNLDTLHVKADDAMANFAWGMIHFITGNMQQAEIKLRNSLRVDSTSPLAWHYLGKILFAQERWMEADVMFNHAIKFHLKREVFEMYVTEQILKRKDDPLNDCIKQMFETSYYEAVHDRYFLASLSERWGHFAAAEKHYRYIIKIDSSYIGGYQKLWTLYEQLARYADAEDVLKKFMFADKLSGERALFAFYQRMIERFPKDKQAYFNAANFLYHLVEGEPESFVRDHKIIPPDSDEAVLVRPFPANSFDAPEKLPGTGEQLILAPQIAKPFSDGIAFFLIADSLYDEDEVLAEINQKTGDLYSWQGLGKRSIPHYRKSVALQPANADTRMKLIAALTTNYKLSEALAALDSLRQRRQLNFDMQLLMAKFTAHAARFEDASTLINEAAKVYPYSLTNTLEIQARLQFLKNNPREALNGYKKLLVMQPHDPNVLYNLAITNAQMRNEAQAIGFLNQSIDNGFNYGWVVNADPNWKSYRNKNSWKAAVKKMEKKTYE